MSLGISIRKKLYDFVMFNSDKIEEGMVKQYASNTKKFYEHLEECEECQSKLASIWKHTYE